jgi:hypothetical protein
VVVKGDESVGTYGACYSVVDIGNLLRSARHFEAKLIHL